MQPSRPRVLPSVLLLTLAGLLLTLFGPFDLPLARAVANGEAANLVLGQPDLTTIASAAGMNGPYDVAVDPVSGKVFVADSSNHRVLRFASAASLANGAPAEGVLGQANFTCTWPNRTGWVDVNTLRFPNGVAVDSTGTLWVADSGNNRVLRFDNAASKGDGADADGVLGQADFTSNWANRDGGTVAANTLSRPQRVAVDGTTLWVADSSNHRVLRFATTTSPFNGADAVGILGQADFISNWANRGGGTTTAANTLNNPIGVTVDSTGTLWVADAWNNRVLRFDNAASKTASANDANGVLGQAGFTSGWSNRGSGAATNTLNNPIGVTVDSTGTLWVADTYNNRVLRFDNAASKTASANDANGVLGQADFTSYWSNRDGPVAANTLYLPDGVAVSGDGTLLVADTNNNRVLRFSSATTKNDGAAADGVLGQADFTSNASTVTANRLHLPDGVAVDPTTGKVFVADSNNSRVLRFASAASLANGAAAEGVLGQADFTSYWSNRDNGVVAANTLNYPVAVTVSGDGTLWVVDSGNNRVLRFASAASKGNGADADGVLGQANFTSNLANRDGAVAANTLSYPYAVAVDSNGTLWVSDGNNHRVLRFDNAVTKNLDAGADGVLGQADLTSNVANRNSTVDANTLNYPGGVAVESDGTLWVADTSNNRVLRFDNAAGKTAAANAADGVLGQADLMNNYANRDSVVAANTLDNPYAVAVDSNGTLWVADTYNHRVLRFASAASKPAGAPADSVLGQTDGAGYLFNGGGSATANTLYHPDGVAVSGDGTLWVADTYNNRILRYGTATNADLSGLVLSSGPLTPSFDAATHDYTATVPFIVSTLIITPTVSDTNATVTVSGTLATTPVTLTVGANAIPVVVTAQDRTTTKTYTVTVTRAASTNADLSGLVLSSGPFSPTFDAAAQDYTATVPYTVTSLTVTPTVSDTNATVTVSGTDATTPVTLTVGANAIPVVVTAQDTTITKTYTITVTRDAAATNADLSDLVLSSGPFSPSFDAATQDYTATVNTASITVTPTLSDSINATVTVSGTSATTPVRVSLVLGANVIPVVVTAQDTTITKTYTITVTRTSTDANLSNLELSSGSLTPGFVATTQDYTATVPYTVSTLTITPTVSDGTASVKVNGGTATSGRSTMISGLIVGTNPITVEVTAQDTSTKIYTVIVTREAATGNANADLSNLMLSSGTLSPTFAAAKTSYTVAVSNSVASLTVTPTISDTNATVKVRGVTVASGRASSSITLTVGVNVIPVVVTAADGTTTKTYTVSVTRAGTADVGLGQAYKLVKGTGTQAVSLAAISNTLTLTITVSNVGPDAVTGIGVTDSFPAAAAGTVWTWTCVGAGGAVCGNASGTGNLNETLGLLPKDGSVTFVVKGSLLNPNNWSNTPRLITPTGVTNSASGNPPVIVGNFLTFVPLIAR